MTSPSPTTPLDPRWPHVLTTDLPDPVLRCLPIESLVVDPYYQRQLNAPHVRDLAASWADPFPVIWVSLRDDGKYYILNGQHRRDALRDRGVKEVMCLVHTGMTRAQESARFRTLNAGQLIDTPEHLWEVDRKAGDPLICALDAIVEQEGCFIGRRWRHRDNPNVIGCPTSLVRIATGPGGRRAEADPERVRRVLQFVRRAWPGQPEATQVETLTGVAEFLRRFGTVKQFDFNEAIVRAANLPLPETIEYARNQPKEGKKVQQHIRAIDAFVQALQRAYDKNRQHRLLPHQSDVR
jgi:hypothetical protein